MLSSMKKTQCLTKPNKMDITPSMIKQLRESTGAGMMECKKALMEAEGNNDGAIEILRKSGQAKAAKKSARVAAEGLIAVRIAPDNKTATLLEINCETDFVAKDKQFNDFCGSAANATLDNDVNTIEDLEKFSDTQAKIKDLQLSLAAKLGENIQIRRFDKMRRQGDILASYNHGNRIGVLVDMKDGNAELAKDIAMHIAASKPLCISEQELSPELLAKEREILTEQTKQSGKPDHLIDKIVTGKLKKYLNEITLLGQAFVKDLDQTVAQKLKAHSASVQAFMRYEIGEGIERKQENFAEEVMAQVKQS